MLSEAPLNAEMDEYPAYSLDHNVPLLVTIGLPPAEDEDEDEKWLVGEDMKLQATVLRSELPVLEGALATALRHYLTVQDPDVASWKGRAHPPRYQFRVRTSGRVRRAHPSSGSAALVRLLSVSCPSLLTL